MLIDEAGAELCSKGIGIPKTGKQNGRLSGGRKGTSRGWGLGTGHGEKGFIRIDRITHVWKMPDETHDFVCSLQN